MFNLMAWHERQKGVVRLFSMFIVLLPSIVLLLLPNTLYLGLVSLCLLITLRLFFLRGCNKERDSGKSIESLLGKKELGDSDEGDLNVLIRYVKLEQSKKIFMETNCEDNKIPIRICDCEKCRRLKKRFEVE